MLLPGPRGEVALISEARGARGSATPVSVVEAGPVRAVSHLAEDRELEAVRRDEAERRRQERLREAMRILDAVG